MSTPSLLNVPYRLKAGTLYSQIPETGLGDFVVTRSASNVATRINSLGFIERVNDNVPRLDYPLGGAVNGCPALLVEPAATNSIRNNTMVGAVAGTPGTLPTNHSTALSGLTRTIVGVGSENGVDYIDIQVSGTATATIFVYAPETTTQIVAAQNQAWTESVWMKAISDVVGNRPAARLTMYEYTAAGAYVTEGSATIALTSSLTRFSFTRTLTGATTERVMPRIEIPLTNGTAYNFTIRIGLPQMELGGVATSVIPTTTAAITRGADVIRKTGITSLIGQSEGTVYFEVEVTDEARNKWFFTLDSASNSFIQAWISPTRTINIQIQNNASIVMTALVSSALTVGYHKVAFAYNSATNGCIMYIDGAQNPVATRTVVAPGLPAFNNMSFGTYLSTTADTLKAHVRAGAVYPNRLSDTELATLTA
jgi:hypothetical protein